MITNSTNSFVNDHAKCITIGPTKKGLPSLTTLPNVIHGLIISYLTPQEVACIICRVCKSINWMQNHYWREQFSKNFGKEISTDVQWKERFKQNHYLISYILGQGGYYEDNFNLTGPTKNLLIYQNKVNSKGRGFSKIMPLVFNKHTMQIKEYYEQPRSDDIRVIISFAYYHFNVRHHEQDCLWDAKLIIRFGIPQVFVEKNGDLPRHREIQKRMWKFIRNEQQDVLEKLRLLEKSLNFKYNIMIEEAAKKNLQILSSIDHINKLHVNPYNNGKTFFCNEHGELRPFVEGSREAREQKMKCYAVVSSEDQNYPLIQWDEYTRANLESLDPFQVFFQRHHTICVLSRTAQLMSKRLGLDVGEIEEIAEDESTLLKAVDGIYQFTAPLSLHHVWLKNSEADAKDKEARS